MSYDVSGGPTCKRWLRCYKTNASGHGGAVTIGGDPRGPEYSTPVEVCVAWIPRNPYGGQGETLYSWGIHGVPYEAALMPGISETTDVYRQPCPPQTDRRSLRGRTACGRSALREAKHNLTKILNAHWRPGDRDHAELRLKPLTGDWECVE